MIIDHETKLVVAPEPFFRFLPGGQVEARTRSKVLLIPLAAYRVLLDFNEPRTFDEALARIGTLSRGELGNIVDEMRERGLLTRVVAETEGGGEADDGGFARLFRRGTFDDPAVVLHVTELLAGGRAVVIPNVFTEDIAEQLHEDLETRMRWRACEEHEQFGHFRFRNADLDRYFPTSITNLKQTLGSAAAKRFMARLSGKNCEGALEFGASWYMPGDHTHPHDDNWAHRSIVAIWNFSKAWDPTWGGSFFWAPTGTHVLPQFNCLTLFTVTRSSLHQVCVVSPFAQRKRLTVNAWWTNAGPPPDPVQRGARMGAVYPPAAYGSAHLVVPGGSGIVAI